MMVKIQEDGMEFVMEPKTEPAESLFGYCDQCAANKTCLQESELMKICGALEENLIGHHCTSATKIEPGPKIYHAANKNDAKEIVGGKVEWFDGVLYLIGSLTKVGDGLIPFEIDNLLNATVIREIPTTTITMTEARAKYGIPDSVIIEGD